MKKIMKFFTILLVSLLAVGSLAGCQLNDDTPTGDKDKELLSADMTDYELGKTGHAYVEVRVTELLESLKNPEGERRVYYMGFVGCPWCMEIVPVLNEVALAEEVTVYYVNTRGVTEEEDAALEEVKALLAPYLAVDADGNPILYVPDVLVVEKGQVLSNHIGTVDSHNAHEREMTEDELAALTAQLTEELNTEYVVEVEGLVIEEEVDVEAEVEAETQETTEETE